MWVRSALAALSGTLAPGCITQDVQFEVPRDYPPSIESSPTAEHPINEVIVVEPSTSSGDAGVGSSSIVLDVQVRDPNIQQRLRYRLFIDYMRGTPSPTIVDEQPIPPSMELVRNVRIEVPIRPYLASPRCHRIELFVSSSFREAGPTARLPTNEGDLATATWWVATRDSDAPMSPVDMTTCPQ
jgi:hypothetical protein